MTGPLRIVTALCALLYFGASVFHSGILVRGSILDAATIPEAVLGLVLVGGLLGLIRSALLTLRDRDRRHALRPDHRHRPRRTRRRPVDPHRDADRSRHRPCLHPDGQAPPGGLARRSERIIASTPSCDRWGGRSSTFSPSPHGSILSARTHARDIRDGGSPLPHFAESPE